jgi:hypothetical protein
MQKSTYFLINIETNCQEMTKNLGLDKLLDLDQDFYIWTMMSRQNREVSISIKILLSRWTFWQCQDFLDCWVKLFDDVEIESLEQDTIKTNQDPQAYINVKKLEFLCLD